MVGRGGRLVALMIIFCVLGAGFTLNIPAIAQYDPDALLTTVVVTTTTAVVPENVSICVVRLGIVQPSGAVLWMPGYVYPGLSPSQCQNKTEYYTDVLGQTVVNHQFLETTIIYTAVVVTITETETLG
jgi:hypothetical protein